MNIVKLDPKGLVITRKRKKWKFAHFKAFENCFELDKTAPQTTWQHITSFLPAKQPIVLELAAGTAQLSLELARRYPKTNFIAMDIKSDRLYSSAKMALEQGIKNIAFVRLSLLRVGELCGSGRVDALWLTFPDPYERKRSIRRRLTHAQYLQQYRKILKPTGTLHFKTDNRPLFLWSLEQLVADHWHVTELSFDLHESPLPADYKIQTAYERRFVTQGLAINFGSFRPEPMIKITGRHTKH